MKGRSGARVGEELRPRHRLHKSAEFVRCYRRGEKRHGSLVALHVHANEAGEPRLGMTVSRKVGKAVVRQRIKRRLREIFRRWPGRAELGAVDVVVHVKPPAARADFEALRREVERSLSSLLAGGKKAGGRKRA